MDSVYGAILVASTALVVVSGLWTAIRLHKEHRFSALAVISSVLGPLLALFIYSRILDAGLKDWASWVLVLVGLALGLFAGARIPLYARGQVLTRAASWHLLPPTLAIACLQLSGLRAGLDDFVLALAGLYAATGFAVGATAVFLLRRLRVSAPRTLVPLGRDGSASLAPPGRATRVTPSAPSTEARCPRCGSPRKPDWRYCVRCGAPHRI
ncbi:MAG: zinc ribbon domain-containing protein [Dehalococcoidales bacterium]|nr:zinc ribbon domain-containing protein [Dehalococcoidales bacterium]